MKYYTNYHLLFFVCIPYYVKIHLKGGDFLANIYDSFNAPVLSAALDDMIQQAFKIQESTSLSLSLAFNSSLQPAIEAIENMKLNISEELSNCIAAINQQNHALVENMQNLMKEYTNEALSSLFESLNSNIETFENSFEDLTSMPELNYDDIISSFNEFVDYVDVNDSSVDDEAAFLPPEIPASNTINWGQQLSIILAILSFLLSFATYIESKDTHYQDEYLKVLNNINSNLEVLISEK